MTVELYLQVVDHSEAEWPSWTTARPPRPSGWDAQLLPGAPSGPASHDTTPRMFVGEVPPDAGLVSRDGTPPTAVRVQAVLGDAERVIDEALIEQILVAFGADDTPGYRTGSPVEVWKFLRTHQGRRMRVVRALSAEPVAAVESTEPSRGVEVATIYSPPVTDLAPAIPGAVPTRFARWDALADWLTLATLRAVVVGIVALHLFVLVGEALIATP